MRRRIVRLTNGFSKSRRIHAAAVALHYMHYNFCRVIGRFASRRNGSRPRPARPGHRRNHRRAGDDWSLKPMDIWHDRAVFHFLTTAEDRIRYRAHLRHTLKRDGTAIVATFAPDGPATCSGVPVVRYSPELVAVELGDEFSLVDAVPYIHHTPWGSRQSFQYSRFCTPLD